jgi:hypothetical protein
MKSSFSFSRFGDQAQEQSAVRGVLRRVHRRQLFAEDELVAVLLDDVADVVALEWDRELPARHGVAR